MKKSIILILSLAVTAFALVTTSCETTKTSDETPVVTTPVSTEEDEVVDVSDEDVAIVNEEIADNTDTDVDEDEYYQPNYQNEVYKDKKSFISFGNTEKFILTETVSLFEPNAVGKYVQRGGSITIEPKEQMAGFGAPYLLAYYIITMDEKNRNLFIASVDSYLKDFSDKKLIRKSNKTYKQYGSVDVKLWWGSIKASTPNYGKAKCSLGYEFYEGSPYYCLSIRPTINDYSIEVNPEADRESLNLKYYFTKAQAKELTKYLNSNYLSKVFYDYEMSIYGGELQDADLY